MTLSPIPSPLSLELSNWGPNVIGSTGGSGSRAFARVARRAGMFTGAGLRDDEDARGFAEYYDCWINAYVSHRDTPATGEVVQALMLGDLSPLLRRHVDGFEGHAPWGWKEPRSIYLLPFYDACLPGLRFLHVVRDGRDMALSANQNQLRMHGRTYLGRPVKHGSAVDSITLWGRLNQDAARYGEERLGDRYLRLRFEDLCHEPAGTAAKILAFFGLDGDPEEAAAHVHSPETLERWRGLDPGLLAELEAAVGPALVELGYAPSAQFV